MPVSLRLIFAASTAFIVLVVAASTLAITLTVSLAAVRSTGQSLAAAIESTVQAEVSNYMGQAESQLWDYVDMARRPEFLLPTNDTDPVWYEKWLIPMRVNLIAANYDYTSMSLLTHDGGLLAAVPLQQYASYGLVVVDPHTLAATGSGLYYSWIYNKTTQQLWNETIYGEKPNLAVTRGDQRVPGYYAIIQFSGKSASCVWFPPTLTVQVIFASMFTLYGACTVYNGSAALMGTINIGRRLDGIGQFLEGTGKTTNTQIFIVDNYQLLVASTLSSVPFVTIYDPSEKSPIENCVSSKDTSPIGLPVKIGCRAYAKDYPYPPLQSIASSDESFLLQPGKIQRYGNLADDNYYYISSRIRSRLTAYTMNLLLFMPETDILGDIISGRNLAIGVTVAVFVLAAALTTVMTGFMLAPLDDVARRMYRTAQMEDDDDAGLRVVDEALSNNPREAAASKPVSAPMRDSQFAEIKALQMAYTTMDTAIKSFTRYVPRDVVKELMATNQMCEIAMQSKHCSMLFTDIAGFTSICERVPTHVLSQLVRLFFERSSAIVMGHGGIIDKFIGDCIMAVFGAPVAIDNTQLRAALCARSLVYDTSSDPLKTAFGDAKEELKIRVGVSSGDVLAGNMGSEARMSYTVIGDDVNLASRLEGLNKAWGTQVMVSEATADECDEYLAMRFVVQVAVVGKKEPVRVYEVLGVLPDANTEAVGRVTTEASENMTMQQVERDAAKNEMDARYGVQQSGANVNQVASVGKLLRRCLRKVQVSAEELTFARVYGDAMEKFVKGKFGESLAVLRGLASRHDVPTGCWDVRSVHNLMEANERYLREAPGADFNGVWVATEK